MSPGYDSAFHEKYRRSVSDDDDNEISHDDIEDVAGDEIRKIDTKTSQISKRSRISRILSRASGVKDADDDVAPTVIPVSDLDHGGSVVGWEGPDDPAMPLNFDARRKWIVVTCLGLITLFSPLSSSILAPAINAVEAEFGSTDTTKASLPVSIFLLGYAVGPLFLSPLSEIYGRAVVLSGANAFFCVWHIGCALAPSLDALIVFRFLCGVGGAGCMTLGGAVIGDLFPVIERGKALSAWSIGPIVGPTLGPLIGAFIVGSIGWRWDPWIVFIPSTIVTAALAWYLPETCHKVLIDRKVKRLSRELQRDDLVNCYDTPGKTRLSQTRLLLLGLTRPLKMLVLAPIILLMSVNVAFNYGTMYLMFNTIPPTFEGQYGFPTSLTGLIYLALGLGYALGLWSFSLLSDRTVLRLIKRNNGVFEPEMRLHLVTWYACVAPITFFWYGWTTYYKVHWIAPILSLIPFGIAILGVYLPTQAYIIDAYPLYSASGLAAFTVLRSVVAAFLPLAGPSLFGSLGLGWGSSVLGFITVGLIPIPVLVLLFGTKLRKKYPVKL
ncbi:major facilitator superfamily domain-containing protein [Xylaria sp. FL0064]|nr:major facilitator superfamily domain-containing protein [Xylaria sp. FL0064]